MKVLIEMFVGMGILVALMTWSPKVKKSQKDTDAAFAHLDSVGTFGHVI